MRQVHGDDGICPSGWRNARGLPFRGERMHGIEIDVFIVI